jgi:hypothetical protein
MTLVSNMNKPRRGPKRLKQFYWIGEGRCRVTDGRKIIGEIHPQEGRTFLVYDADGGFFGSFHCFEEAAEYLAAVNEELLARKTEEED